MLCKRAIIDARLQISCDHSVPLENGKFVNFLAVSQVLQREAFKIYEQICQPSSDVQSFEF